ncbi:hypothetical protein Vadar_010718 [Vaccinium darrowii]|uniref:Uncharacterized protein n=1 Tax=Vaccinium darrowii TaxID=229202 RepID=A0ACB7ZBS5_9ERIC|nr:hypothetical protein Vadar_010718 [Vaccinium darrowii]
MARTRSTSIREEAQKRRRIVEEEDVISQLPDDILLAILSLLSFVEAASSCVLSKRWKSLWTHLTVLNFEFPKMLKEPIKIAESMPVARAKFVGWVNRALRLHQGPVVNEFKLHFFFTRKTFCRHIDKWFNFAIRKSVQRLEVNLSPTRPVSPQSKAKYYFFPNQFFDLIKSPHGLSCIKSLTELSLRFVDVTGELVEHLLSNCPLLLRLSVSDSTSLVNLNVSGPSLCLKFLEIKLCVCLQSIDIYAPYLTSFICIGGMTQVLVRLRHAPSLVCLTLEHRGGILTAFPSISSCFSQLESLTLDIYVGMVSMHLSLSIDVLVSGIIMWLIANFLFQFSSAPPPLPELTNLKNLTFQGMIESGYSLLGWASLIERCPCLHKFTSQMWSRFNLKKEVSRPAERLHKCLKVVEFVFNIDFELAAYFVQNALVLEKIIVDCCSGRLVRPGCNVAEDWLELPKHAQKLKKELPPEVELVII